MVNQIDETRSVGIQRIANLVSAYVSNNHVAPGDLPTLIASVHTAISSLTGDSLASQLAEATVEKLTSSQIRKSLTADAIISFLDGKPYKTLKRHLTAHGLDPNSYRAKFGLPADYPMVAVSYSETRSSLARTIGLGHVSGRGSKEDAAPRGKSRRSAT